MDRVHRRPSLGVNHGLVDVLGCKAEAQRQAVEVLGYGWSQVDQELMASQAKKEETVFFVPRPEERNNETCWQHILSRQL